MAFHSLNMGAHMIKFNSAVSSDFLDMYTKILEQEITDKAIEPKHKTFAPSQMRCDRVSWFRLRGTQPDTVKNPDLAMDFTAQVGTACHEAIQNRLFNKLGTDWIAVAVWLEMHKDWFEGYDMELNIRPGSFETQIEMRKPFPVRFACDGIINFEGKVRLLEIKTAEFSSLQDLTGPKEKHLDQIKCYATLLHIPDVLFLYQDRQWGELKCFEITVDEIEQQRVREKMQNVLDLVEANIAPEGLPIGDPDCSSSMCPYFKVCKEWGR